MAIKKKQSKKRTGNKLSSKADIERMMAEDAEAEGSHVAIGEGNLISVKGGAFTFQGADLGEEMEVVVVDFVNEKNYYDGDYDPDETTSPACWSLMKVKPNAMVPSKSSVKGQCNECSPCWANEYGSADKGKGKACKDYRRIAVVAVEDLENLSEAEVAYIKVPPTSTKAFDKMANGVRKLFKRPMYGVVTEISFDDDFDYPRLIFKAVKPIEDASILMGLKKIRESIEEDLMQEPDPDNYQEPKPKKSKGNKNKKSGKSKSRK